MARRSFPARSTSRRRTYEVLPEAPAAALVTPLTAEAPAALPALAEPEFPHRDQDARHRLAYDGRREYDVRDLLRCLVDAGTMDEYKADYVQDARSPFSPRLGGAPSGSWPTSGMRVQSKATGHADAGSSSTPTRPTRPLRFIMGTATRRGCRCCFCKTCPASWLARTPSKAASSVPARRMVRRPQQLHRAQDHCHHGAVPNGGGQLRDVWQGL